MSQCGAARVSEGGAAELDLPTQIENAGLAAFFKDKKKVVLIGSITDADLKRRRSFHEKDSHMIHSFKSDKEASVWVNEQGIGWSCRKGLKPESPNQDSFSVLLVEGEFALYCVYDGHGPCGHDISHYVRETLVKLFVGSEVRTTNPKLAFERAFVGVQQLLEQPDGEALDATMSGTTCTMAYHDFARDRLTIAHVGDSRAVIGCKHKDIVSQDLTQDHKPNLPEEKRRIESADPPGRVVFDGYYNHRVFAQKGLYPGLNMSRAIGDVIGHKEAGLTAFPDVKEIDLRDFRKGGDSGLSLLLCTDGVWEFISSEEATRLVFEYPPSKAKDAMIKLVSLGWERWMQDSDHEISDDITGILVDMSKPPC